jgi:inhibitor of cysteine peptidase
MNRNLKRKIGLFTTYAIVSIFLVISLALFGKANGEITSFGPADNGRILALAPGTVITVALPENPSTGYAWSPEIDKIVGQILEDEFIPSGDNLLGAGGTHLFKIKIIGAGEIRFSYMRPWENCPSETFRLTVTG